MRRAKTLIIGLMLLVVALLAAIAIGETPKACKVTDLAGYNAALAAPKDSKSLDERLIIYIVQPDTTWRVYPGNIGADFYHNAFLAYAIDTLLSLNEGESFSKTMIWDGKDSVANFGYNLTDTSDCKTYHSFAEDNIKVIAALFDQSAGHAASSDTVGGSAAPFLAYYCDAAAAATVDSQWCNNVSENFTHSVFAEVGTATWCSACPSMNYYMHLVDLLYDLPFYYVEMVYDVDSIASARMTDYNLSWVPTAYFDGGYRVQVGSEPDWTVADTIMSVGSRAVNPFGLCVSVNWLGDGRLEITVELSPNSAPQKPAAPSGPVAGKNGVSLQYTASTTDPETDDVYFKFIWKDGDTSSWLGPYSSGTNCLAPHSWASPGTYSVKVKARDKWNFETIWSDPITVKIYDYVAGDADDNGTVNILDVGYIIRYLYKGGSAPNHAAAADADGNNNVNILDVGYIVGYLYKGGPPPIYR